MAEMRSVYIAGPMAGKVALNFKEFYRWQLYFEERGWAVQNPAEHTVLYMVEHGEFPGWEKAMAYDIQLMSRCSHAFFMEGWKESRGARVEHSYADESAVIETLYEEELEDV